MSRIISLVALMVAFAMPALAQSPIIGLPPPPDPRLAAAILKSGVIEKWHEAENQATLLQAQLTLAQQDKAALDRWVHDYFNPPPAPEEKSDKSRRSQPSSPDTRHDGR